MKSSDIKLDDLDTHRPIGKFRLDVILTAVTGIFAIDWEDEFWKKHPSDQPFQHEVGVMLSYLAIDQLPELHQMERYSKDLTNGVLEQLRLDPELQEIIGTIPPEDSTREERMKWFHELVLSYPMDRLIELSPPLGLEHTREVDPAVEYGLLASRAIVATLEEQPE